MRVDNSRDRRAERSLVPNTRYGRVQLCLREAARWCCRSPEWPVGPETQELRRRYAELETSYEGIMTLRSGKSIDAYFVHGKELGRGGFGTVWQATPTRRAVKAQPALSEKKSYAVKRVKLPLRDRDFEMISKSFLSISTQRMLHFLQVIGSEEATKNHVTRNLLRILDIPHTMYIAMDLLEGPTLRDWMSENKNLTETNAAELTRQMLRAVHFLHRTAGALHRDVKPQNFGFAAPVGDQLPMLQLFDMGLVYVLPEPVVEETAQQLFDLGLGGTLHWIAPETWEGRSGAASDLWSVGLILHVLLLKVLPFSLQSCKEPQETRQAIAKGQLAQQGASKEGLALAARLLAKDPKERATSTEALDNAWLKAPPKTKHTVASAASAQKRCQLPEEVERWKDRSFWHSLMLSQGHWLKAE